MKQLRAKSRKLFGEFQRVKNTDIDMPISTQGQGHTYMPMQDINPDPQLFSEEPMTQEESVGPTPELSQDSEDQSQGQLKTAQANIEEQRSKKLASFENPSSDNTIEEAEDSSEDGDQASQEQARVIEAAAKRTRAKRQDCRVHQGQLEGSQLSGTQAKQRKTQRSNQATQSQDGSQLSDSQMREKLENLQRDNNEFLANFPNARQRTTEQRDWITSMRNRITKIKHTLE